MACCMSSTGSFKVTGITNSDIAEAIETADENRAEEFKTFDERMAVIEEAMCNWAQPEYGDDGESFEKTFWKAAMIAVATINSLAQIEIQEKRHKIADGFEKIAEDRQNRFKNAYAPLERMIIFETSSTPIPVPDYFFSRIRGEAYTRTAFQDGSRGINKLAKKYALCIDPSLLDDLVYAEAIARDDSINFNYRDEEFFALVMDDQRFNRRNASLNIGKDNAAQSTAYAQAANKTLASLGEIANQGAQGAMQLFGYLSARRDTQYPTQFSAATPLFGYSGNFGSFVSAGPVDG